MLPLIVILLAFLAPLIAANEFTVHNNCTQDYYVWKLARNVSTAFHLPKSGGYYATDLITQADPTWKSGVTIAISANPTGIFTGSPTLNLAYNVVPATQDQPAMIWYDLNTVNGSPLAGSPVEFVGDACPPIIWPNGVPTSQSHIKHCWDGVEMGLWLCPYLFDEPGLDE